MTKDSSLAAGFLKHIARRSYEILTNILKKQAITSTIFLKKDPMISCPSEGNRSRSFP
jgi:hypothetical protein